MKSRNCEAYNYIIVVYLEESQILMEESSAKWVPCSNFKQTSVIGFSFNVSDQSVSHADNDACVGYLRCEPPPTSSSHIAVCWDCRALREVLYHRTRTHSVCVNSLPWPTWCEEQQSTCSQSLCLFIFTFCQVPEASI
jgi:hypothetical protein